MTVPASGHGTGAAAAPRSGDLDVLVLSVVAELAAAGLTVATAESLTAGLLAATIVDVPGASAVFRGALVVYHDDLKTSLAGVDPAVLADGGAVQSRVAAELAAGARRRCRADLGIGTTGVAGPDAVDGRPAGTVFVAVAGPGGPPVVRPLALPGDRAAVRRESVRAALELLRSTLPRGERQDAPTWTADR